VPRSGGEGARYRCFTARGLPGFRLTLAAALFADPQLFVTFTQNCVGVVSAADLKLDESVPTGFVSSPAGPWNHA
jgi:hypothetical protein